MSKWNAFGGALSITIVVWSTGALICAASANWPAAKWLGVESVVAVLAQHQWGRA